MSTEATDIRRVNAKLHAQSYTDKEILDFYGATLQAALTGACANPEFSRFEHKTIAPSSLASDMQPLEAYARAMTERRFGVKLVLVGDKEAAPPRRILA